MLERREPGLIVTLIETVSALLEPLAPGGAFYGEAPTLPVDGSGAPEAFITWQRIASTDNVALDGATDLQNTRIQVDIFAPRILDAEAIRKTVDAALATLPSTVPLSSADVWEGEVRLWRITRDFSVWFIETP